MRKQYQIFRYVYSLHSSDSIAGRTCAHLPSKSAASEQSNLPKTFIRVPADGVIYANSLTDRTLTAEGRGIKYYHCFYADTNGNIKFRRFSCYCRLFISSEFDYCSNRYILW